MAIGYMQKKFGEDRPCDFKVVRADRQMDILVTILRDQKNNKAVVVINSCDVSMYVCLINQ